MRVLTAVFPDGEVEVVVACFHVVEAAGGGEAVGVIGLEVV